MSNKEITVSDIEKVLTEMSLKESKKRTITFVQGCLTYGITTRSEKDLGICGNPDCKNCVNMSNVLKETVKNYLNDRRK